MDEFTHTQKKQEQIYYITILLVLLILLEFLHEYSNKIRNNKY